MSSSSSSSPSSLSNNNGGGAHILVFPYPTSGHIIPILDLANQLLARRLTITVLLTPQNLPLLQTFLISSPYASSVHTLLLPFPNPPSSNPSLAAKVHASAQLSEPILEWFRSHSSPPVAIISDFFLGWTNQLASQLGIPRLAFWPSSAQRSLLIHHIWRNPQLFLQEDRLISFPDVPNSPTYLKWQVCQLVTQYTKEDPDWEFFRNGMIANAHSWGAVYNSFSDLEGVYIDHVKKQMGHQRVYAVGPLLPNSSDTGSSSSKRGGSSVVPVDDVIAWLDTKTGAQNPVVYVCFGSRVELSSEQMDSLTAALESSGVHFILCVKSNQEYMITKEYEDRVSGRGLIIKGWAPQVEILRHAAVGAFLTHCGWNSILEGIAAGVVMLTWPMGADQFTNAKFLVDQVGVAMEACEGGATNVPNPTKLANIFVESLSITNGNGGGCAKRERVMKLRDAALRAVRNGDGSSSKDMELLTHQLNALKG